MELNRHLVNVTERECCNRREAHLPPSPLSLSVALRWHDTLSLSSAPSSLRFLQKQMLSPSQRLSLHPLPAVWLCEWKDGRRMNEGWWIGWVYLAWPVPLQEPLQCCNPLLTHTHSISQALFLSDPPVCFSGFSWSRIIYEWAGVNESTGLSSCEQRMSHICREREWKTMRGESIYWVKDIMTGIHQLLVLLSQW